MSMSFRRALSSARWEGLYTQKVLQLLDNKRTKLCTMRPDRTVYAAIAHMVDRKVGSLVVMDEGRMVGILTERDYMTKVILRNRASKTTRIADIMTRGVIAVDPHATVGQCLHLMSQHSIRHLPVLQQHELVGLLSVRDLLSHIVDEHLAQTATLQAQLRRLAALTAHPPH